MVAQEQEDGLLNRRSPAPPILGDILSLVFGTNPFVTVTPTNPVPTPPINTPTDNGPKPTPTNTLVPQTPTVPATQGILPSDTRTPVNTNPSPGTSTAPNGVVASSNPKPGTSTAPNNVASSNPTPGPSTAPSGDVTSSNPTPRPLVASSGDVVSSNPTPGPFTTPSGDISSSSPTPGPLTASSGDVASSNPTPGPSTVPSGDVTSPNSTPGPSTTISSNASTSTALSSNSGVSDTLNPNASSTPPSSDETPTAFLVYSPLSSSPFMSTESETGLVSGSPRPTDTASVNNERSRDLNIAALVGGLVGAVVGIALLAFVLVILVRRRRAHQANADMDDSAALLDASKRQSVAARRLSSLTISTAESQTHPVSYCTLEYDLNYHPEASDYPDALVVGRPSTSLSQQVDRLKSSDDTHHSKLSTHRLSNSNFTVPEKASRNGSSTALQYVAEADITAAGDKTATSTGRMSIIPVLPEINVQRGLSVVPESPVTPTPGDFSESPVVGPIDNDSFYWRLSSISRITTKSSGSLYSEDRA